MKKLFIMLFLLFTFLNTVKAETINSKSGNAFFDRTSQTWVYWPSGELGNIATNRMPASSVFLYDILSTNYDPWTSLRPDTLSYSASSSHSAGMSASFLYGNTTADPGTPTWVPLLATANKVLATVYCGTATSCTTPTNITGDGLDSSILVVPSGAYTLELSGTTWNKIRSDFNQSTTGITTNGEGATVVMTTSPMNKYTMIVDRTAGATDVVEIDLQCSINNVAFVQIATILTLVGEPTLTSIGDVPCRYIRYNVVTIGVGNTLSIDLLAVR